MTTTMQLIAKQTVGAGGASSVTFSNIPQTYTDLKVVVSARSNKADVTDYMYYTFSGSSSYAPTKVLYGSGASAGSFNWSSVSGITAGIINAANNTASTFSSIDIYIPNYTLSQYKSTSTDTTQEGNTGTNIYATLNAGLSNSNTAISSITFNCESGSNSFVEFSTFYLYGISNNTTTQATTVPYASGGDVITTDGSYWYHAFKYSGSFTPLKALTADVLVVAGGGGGGGNGDSGGGGAGGLLTFTSQALTSNTALTCTVGAGGVGNTVGQGTNGGDSQFGALTLVKGGGGGGSDWAGNTLAGLDGGSGGGSGNWYSIYTGNGGSPTSGQGYAGGKSTNDNNQGGGGGGGAGGPGADQTTLNGAAGGVGFYNTLTDAMGVATTTGQLVSSHYYYAGGGGGGSRSGTVAAAAYGGGGVGAQGTTACTAGTPNTGGGGGGTDNNYSGGGAKGGSGIIIVRYAV